METMSLIQKTGVLAWPLLACSVAALAIFTERMIRFAIIGRKGSNVARRMGALLVQGDDAAARREAKDSDSPMGRVLVKGFDVLDQDRETLETVLTHAIEEEVGSLSRYLQALATICNIAPLLGLLGTVMGLIKAFMVIQQVGGKVNAVALAGGIWEAMLTTALGLIIALPATVAHSYLVDRVEHQEANLEDGAVVFMVSLAKRNKDGKHAGS